MAALLAFAAVAAAESAHNPASATEPLVGHAGERIGNSKFSLNLERIAVAARNAINRNLMDERGQHLGYNAPLGTYLTFIASDYGLSATGPDFAVSAKCDELNRNSTDTKFVGTRVAPDGLPGIDPATDVEVFFASCSSSETGAVGYLDKEKLRYAIDVLIAQPAARKAGSPPEETGALKKLVARPERDPEDHRPLPNAGFAKFTYTSAGRGSLKNITLKVTRHGKFRRTYKYYP